MTNRSREMYGKKGSLSDRNERIGEILERIQNKATLLSAKTERLKALRDHYEAYLNRVYPLKTHSVAIYSSKSHSYENILIQEPSCLMHDLKPKFSNSNFSSSTSSLTKPTIDNRLTSSISNLDFKSALPYENCILKSNDIRPEISISSEYLGSDDSLTHKALGSIGSSSNFSDRLDLNFSTEDLLKPFLTTTSFSYADSKNMDEFDSYKPLKLDSQNSICDCGRSKQFKSPEYSQSFPNRSHDYPHQNLTSRLSPPRSPFRSLSFSSTITKFDASPLLSDRQQHGSRLFVSPKQREYTATVRPKLADLKSPLRRNVSYVSDRTKYNLEKSQSLLDRYSDPPNFLNFERSRSLRDKNIDSFLNDIKSKKNLNLNETYFNKGSVPYTSFRLKKDWQRSNIPTWSPLSSQTSSSSNIGRAKPDYRHVTFAPEVDLPYKKYLSKNFPDNKFSNTNFPSSKAAFSWYKTNYTPAPELHDTKIKNSFRENYSDDSKQALICEKCKNAVVDSASSPRNESSAEKKNLIDNTSRKQGMLHSKEETMDISEQVPKISVEKALDEPLQEVSEQFYRLQTLEEKPSETADPLELSEKKSLNSNNYETPVTVVDQNEGKEIKTDDTREATTSSDGEKLVGTKNLRTGCSKQDGPPNLSVENTLTKNNGDSNNTNKLDENELEKISGQERSINIANGELVLNERKTKSNGDSFDGDDKLNREERREKRAENPKTTLLDNDKELKDFDETLEGETKSKQAVTPKTSIKISENAQSVNDEPKGKTSSKDELPDLKITDPTSENLSLENDLCASKIASFDKSTINNAALKESPTPISKSDDGSDQNQQKKDLTKDPKEVKNDFKAEKAPEQHKIEKNQNKKQENDANMENKEESFQRVEPQRHMTENIKQPEEQHFYNNSLQQEKLERQKPKQPLREQSPEYFDEKSPQIYEEHSQEAYSVHAQRPLDKQAQQPFNDSGHQTYENQQSYEKQSQQSYDDQTRQTYDEQLQQPYEEQLQQEPYEEQLQQQPYEEQLQQQPYEEQLQQQPYDEQLQQQPYHEQLQQQPYEEQLQQQPYDEQLQQQPYEERLQQPYEEQLREPSYEGQQPYRKTGKQPYEENFYEDHVQQPYDELQQKPYDELQRKPYDETFDYKEGNDPHLSGYDQEKTRDYEDHRNFTEHPSYPEYEPNHMAEMFDESSKGQSNVSQEYKHYPEPNKNRDESYDQDIDINYQERRPEVYEGDYSEPNPEYINQQQDGYRHNTNNYLPQQDEYNNAIPNDYQHLPEEFRSNSTTQEYGHPEEDFRRADGPEYHQDQIQKNYSHEYGMNESEYPAKQIGYATDYVDPSGGQYEINSEYIANRREDYVKDSQVPYANGQDFERYNQKMTDDTSSHFTGDSYVDPSSKQYAPQDIGQYEELQDEGTHDPYKDSHYSRPN